MIAAPPSLGICPVCMERTLREHCPSKTCTWHRCLNREGCEATLDLRRRRGVRFDRQSGEYVTVQLGGL